jgi:hypothetical protein
MDSLGEAFSYRNKGYRQIPWMQKKGDDYLPFNLDWGCQVIETVLLVIFGEMLNSSFLEQVSSGNHAQLIIDCANM